MATEGISKNYCFRQGPRQAVPSHASLIELALREQAFEEYKCDSPDDLIHMGISMASLSKILSACGPNDVLQLRYQEGSDIVTFKAESRKNEWVSEVDVEQNHYEVPDKDYNVVATILSAKLLQMCKVLVELGKTLGAKAGKEGLTFSALGDKAGPGSRAPYP